VITQLNPPKPMETSKGVDWAHFVIDPRAAERSASTRSCPMMRNALVVLAAVVIIAGLGIYIAFSGGEAKLQDSAAVGPTPTIRSPTGA
jgi:hypothetical protein